MRVISRTSYATVRPVTTLTSPASQLRYYPVVMAETRSAAARDLTPEDVRRLAAAIGLTIADEDLADVTFRLNAALDHLAALPD